MRIYRQLASEGWGVSRQRIARLMRAMGMASQICKKWAKTTQSNHRWPVAPNLLDRQFALEGLSEVWVSDITYIRGEQDWLQETTVMDLADRQILGWSLADGMSARQTSIAALGQVLAGAAWARGCCSTPTGACNMPAQSLPICWLNTTLFKA